MLFNEQGFIDIDGMIAQVPSFQTIISDGIVTDDELQIQSNRVIDMLHEAEERFNADDQRFIQKLFAETNVLSAIYHIHELQNIR